MVAEIYSLWPISLAEWWHRVKWPTPRPAYRLLLPPGLSELRPGRFFTIINFVIKDILINFAAQTVPFATVMRVHCLGNSARRLKAVGRLPSFFSDNFFCVPSCRSIFLPAGTHRLLSCVKHEKCAFAFWRIRASPCDR